MGLFDVADLIREYSLVAGIVSAQMLSIREVSAEEDPALPRSLEGTQRPSVAKRAMLMLHAFQGVPRL